MDTYVQMNSKNLLFIDLETTGLKYRKDKILEIATIITDKDLNELDSCTFIIHQPDEVLEKMSDWCVETHGKSGLTKKVKSSIITLEDAEQKTLEMIKKYVPEKKGVLAGSSVHFDRDFLRKYMPILFDYLHFHILDVTAIAEVVKRACPKDNAYVQYTVSKHRALEDIRDTINQLKGYYRLYFIK